MYFNTVSLVILAVITRRVIRYTFKIDPVTVIGTAIYGLFLVSVRLFMKFLFKLNDLRQFILLIKREDEELSIPPTNITQYSRYYKLTGLKVIMDDRAKLKIDLQKHHTLIAGLTGSGKTWAISSIILQIVTRPDFLQNYRLIIFDLKPGDNDFLSLWKPIAEYVTVDRDGSTETAIAKLHDIVNNYQDKRRVVVVIDELAKLTTHAMTSDLRRRGMAALSQLSAQIRSRGNIIAATQHPDHKTLERAISGQFERKICLRVDDADVAALVLRRKPDIDPVLFLDGEYIMREPTRREIELAGKFPGLELPQDIDRALAMINEVNSEDDLRIKCLALSISGLKKGDRLPGINRIKSEEMPAPFLEMARRNFVAAGVIKAIADKRGNVAHYTLEKEEVEAIAAVKKFVADGLWEQDPEPIKFGG